MGIQLRCPARYVELAQLRDLEKAKHQIDGVRSHLFFPIWAGIDVAMDALLIAAIADVDLERG